MGDHETWHEVGVVAEGSPIDIGGLNPWEHSWISLGRQRITLPNVTFPNQQHERYVYEIKIDHGAVRFSAEEVSASVWRFLIPS